MVETSATPLPNLAAIDDCWRRIGVSGDASCPLLATHILPQLPDLRAGRHGLLDALAVDDLVDAATLDQPTESAFHIDRARRAVLRGLPRGR